MFLELASKELYLFGIYVEEGHTPLSETIKRYQCFLASSQCITFPDIVRILGEWKFSWNMEFLSLGHRLNRSTKSKQITKEKCELREHWEKYDCWMEWAFLFLLNNSCAYSLCWVMGLTLQEYHSPLITVKLVHELEKISSLKVTGFVYFTMLSLSLCYWSLQIVQF